MISVEVLFFEGCPNHEPTVDLAREVAATVGIPAEIHEVEVEKAEQAKALRFLGSPSVRINGRDIEPGADGRSDFAYGCRVYGTSGVPPRDLMLAAMENA